jgi:hypothetical protein
MIERLMSQIPREFLALAAAVAGFGVLFIVLSLPAGALAFSTVDWRFRPYIAVVVGFFPAAAIAWFIWRGARRKLALPTLCSLPRWVRLTIFALYVCTASFGIPAVHSVLVASEVSEYKRVREEGNRVWPVHPRIELFFSCPVLPGVILSYHEYQLAGLYGWGGWEVHVWYILGARSVVRLPYWVS